MQYLHSIEWKQKIGTLRKNNLLMKEVQYSTKAYYSMLPGTSVRDKKGMHCSKKASENNNSNDKKAKL